MEDIKIINLIKSYKNNSFDFLKLKSVRAPRECVLLEILHDLERKIYYLFLNGIIDGNLYEWLDNEMSGLWCDTCKKIDSYNGEKVPATELQKLIKKCSSDLDWFIRIIGIKIEW